MNGSTANNTTRNAAGRRRGLTLAEILVAIAIVSVLLGILVVSGKAVLRSQNRSDAKQEIMMIAAAIDKYATYWPAWEATDDNGNIVKLADRGWPDYLPGRLFDNTTEVTMPAPFQLDQDRFNLSTTGRTYFIRGTGSGLIESTGKPDQLSRGDVLNANICLAYALTSKTGNGPYLAVDDDQALLQDVAGKVKGYTPNYPPPNPAAATNLHTLSTAGRKLMLVDPWGTPYRYFWVFKTTDTPSGFAPIGDGRRSAITTPGGPNEINAFHKAVGYVLESAGPDRKFGNRWLPPGSDPTADANDAADNIIIQRP